jgi:hypothetical protein
MLRAGPSLIQLLIVCTIYVSQCGVFERCNPREMFDGNGAGRYPRLEENALPREQAGASRM